MKNQKFDFIIAFVLSAIIIVPQMATKHMLYVIEESIIFNPLDWIHYRTEALLRLSITTLLLVIVCSTFLFGLMQLGYRLKRYVHKAK